MSVLPNLNGKTQTTVYRRIITDCEEALARWKNAEKELEFGL